MMRLGEGVEWTVHCAAVLALLPGAATLPANRLAEYHGVPPAYLAKHLQALSRAGIVEAVPGPRGGYRLARPAAAITMLDLVQAVEGPEPAFQCTEIRRRGPAALPDREYRWPCAVTRTMGRAEQAWRTALRSETLADLAATVTSEVPAAAVAKAVPWLEQHVRVRPRTHAMTTGGADQDGRR